MEEEEEALEAVQEWNAQGERACQGGDLDTAEALLSQALDSVRQHAPESSLASDSIQTMGIVFYSRGKLALARQHFQQALAMREK